MRRPGLFRRTALPGATLLLAALAGGCSSGPDPSKFAPACPQLALLRDAADLTRFASATPDPATLVLSARIAAVPAHCMAAGPNKVKATLHVVADVLRGPAAKGDSLRIPYFVALMDGETVLNEQDFALTANFHANADRARVSDLDIDLTMPVTKARSAAAYQIYVGFRLTPAELAYNRKPVAQ